MRLLELPHHPHRRLLRGHGYIKRLGPGIVTGAADDDPSGIGTYSQVGAALGLAPVWPDQGDRDRAHVQDLSGNLVTGSACG